MTEETENWEDLLNVDKIELKKKDEIRFEDEDQELNRKSAEKPKENVKKESHPKASFSLFFF